MPILKSAVLSAAKAAAGQIVKAIDPAERLRLQFDAAVEAADRELDEIFRAVNTALFAHITGRPPTQEQVENLLAAGAKGPGRVYRLLGEARKSTSRTRRQMLAAVLFGLEHSDIPEPDRDRIDMLIERLMPEDIKQLGALAEVEQLPPRYPVENEPEPWSGITLAYDAQLTYAIASRQFRIGSLEWRDFSRLSTVTSEIPLSILLNIGCIAHPVGGGATTANTVKIGAMSYRANDLQITPLGRMLLQALADVRPGLEAAIAPKTS